MELQDFLAAVVPSGLLVAARKVERQTDDGKTYHTFSHTITKNHKSLAEKVVSYAAQQQDAYFALATYKQGFHQNPRTGKKQLRVHDNVDSLKALWLDIDFKAGYANAAEVVAALRAFCKATSLPPPAFLTGSGNGVHVYWPLEEGVPVERWQRLADALKGACAELDLKADPACTADACRILRPPGTTNFKHPGKPKPVKLLYKSTAQYKYEELEVALTPWLPSSRPDPFYGKPVGANNDLTGGLGVGRAEEPAKFAALKDRCKILTDVVETHGKDCEEPMWVAVLQLLKHCEDGEEWVHPVSDGHPGYDANSTDQKWEARQHNTAGPTLCNRFETFRPNVCRTCPHHGHIKTPLQLGRESFKDETGLPPGYRMAEGGRGIERLMIDHSTEPPTRVWDRILRHVVRNLRVTRSILTKRYDLMFDVQLANSKPWTIHLPSGHTGNIRKMAEELAAYGVTFKGKEAKDFGDLMASWIEQMQAARRVVEVTEQLGWLITDDEVTGFSCGESTFYSDGRTRKDVRAAREFANLAKFYEPRGSAASWKEVASFLTEQDNPAFTATLAAAFGAPLLRFTGMSGGILSIASTASGVGKSSALKCSQAVWGSPTHGVNAVDDTVKSVARKLGFLNNLPAYWDELRGKQTVEGFLTLAFQITQGKEKSRLDSSATLRDTNTWETMLVVASNESIFEAMARRAGGSDAGAVRVYEIIVDPFDMDRNRAEVALLFEQLHHNYGHAGRDYAQYLATHAKGVEAEVKDMFKKLAHAVHMQPQERFWVAIMASLLVGAQIANRINLTTINIQTLTRFLIANLNRLRTRTVDSLASMDANEILASFLQSYQDRALIVDEFPAPKTRSAAYLPQIILSPKGGKLTYSLATKQRKVRFSVQEFFRWCDHKELPAYSLSQRFKDELDAKVVRVRLGLGTSYELPQQRCYEITVRQDVDALVDDIVTAGGDLIPAETSGSSSD